MSLGSTVRKLRKAQHMTQEELADKAGISRLCVIHLENSRTDHLRVSTLVKVCSVLGVDLQTLLQ